MNRLCTIMHPQGQRCGEKPRAPAASERFWGAGSLASVSEVRASQMSQRESRPVFCLEVLSLESTLTSSGEGKCHSAPLRSSGILEIGNFGGKSDFGGSEKEVARERGSPACTPVVIRLSSS